MKRRNHDVQVSHRIIREIDEVDTMLSGHEEQEFLTSVMMQKATVMSLLNIGELSKTYSDDLIDATPWMPWQDIRSTRNIAAHTYDSLDMSDVWETYRVDLPEMRREITAIIRRLESGWDVQKEARKQRGK